MRVKIEGMDQALGPTSRSIPRIQNAADPHCYLWMAVERSIFNCWLTPIDLIDRHMTICQKWLTEVLSPVVDN